METNLHLEPGTLRERLGDVWRGGSIGTVSEEEVEKRTGEILGLDQAQVNAFMSDLWEEYLGTLNVELAACFASLRPRYRTAILSNSFVGLAAKSRSATVSATCATLLFTRMRKGSGNQIEPSSN